MGYDVSCIESKIFIPSKDVQTALTALNEGVAPEVYRGSLLAGRWMFDLDAKGNVIEICFDGDKGRDDDELKPLAPYVKDGSFVEMHGEDGARWRWIFSKGKLVTKDAKISW